MLPDAMKVETVAEAAHELLELQAYIHGARAMVDPDVGAMDTETRMRVDVLLRDAQRRIAAVAERLDEFATTVARA